MGAGIQIGGWSGPSRRRVPRFRMLAPLDVTVLRSGIPDTVPGRALDVCERGIAAILAGELKPGDSVGLEVRFSDTAEPLRTRATVRYQDKLRYGLEFMAMSAEQRNAIRVWAKGIRQELEGKDAEADTLNLTVEAAGKAQQRGKLPLGGGGPLRAKPKRWGRVWLMVGVLILVGAAGGWWEWNRSWQELESGSELPQTASVEKPQAQVSAEVMQKLLIHRVEPVYPREARNQHLQGVIAVNVVVGRDGSVVAMHALNGPDILAQAAMDALRWWKFEPYRLNGEPAVVETTVAVEFKR
ncbi:MAG TPA: TonB family protein [Candidatus Sulfotelmatobacter sp.]|nr:TonB family protein [Candidatus Sulfotelmatobacter sp.]